MHKFSPRFIGLFLGLLSFLVSSEASAHVGFHAQASFRVYADRAELNLKLAPQEAWMLLEDPPAFDDEGIAKALESFKARAPHLYEITAGGTKIEAQKAEALQEVDGRIAFVIHYPAVAWPLRIRAVFAHDFGGDFQATLSVFDLRKNPSDPEPTPIAGAIQTETNDTLEVAEPAIGPGGQSSTSNKPGDTPRGNAPPFPQFLRLGIGHILTGYDHLLFLLALLVGCRRVKPMLGIITSFTLAHSLTLALAALDVVRISGRIVEPMIAVSIVFVGVENLIWGEGAKGRARVAFSFGLIHGFGFAGVLREIGLGADGSSVIQPLFAFNLGVEIGQLTVAALVLPALFLLRKFPVANRYATRVISVVVVLAGGSWLIQRLWP